MRLCDGGGTKHRKQNTMAVTLRGDLTRNEKQKQQQRLSGARAVMLNYVQHEPHPAASRHKTVKVRPVIALGLLILQVFY